MAGSTTLTFGITSRIGRLNMRPQRSRSWSNPWTHSTIGYVKSG